VGRHKTIAKDEDSVTVSYRVPATVLDAVDDAASKAGVTRSEVLRELLQRVTKEQIDDAVRAIQLSRLDVSGTYTTAALHQKKANAEKLLAWIDAELQTRAEKILSGVSQS